MSVGHKILARGVVIGRSMTGEGSVRVHLYTDALGLVYALAQSAREERSQLRAHLQRGTYGTFALVNGKSTWRVAGSMNATNLYFALQGRPEAQGSGERVVSFVRQFVRGEGNDPYFFNALWQFVTLLPALAETDVRDAEHVAVVRMLAALGYVDDTKAVHLFLNNSFGAPLIKEARRERRSLLKVINEGISASGLS